MKQLLALTMGLILVISFTSCSKNQKQSRNMEQIHREEGVPVRIITITPRDFEHRLSYNAVMTGIQESTAFASMGEKVEKIHVKVGDQVKKDAVLVTFPTDSPSAKYYQAKVAFENAQTSFERIESLYKAGGISLQTRDNAYARFQVARADWDTVRKMVVVKAPIAGYVTRIHVAETDNVKKETALVTIARTDQLKAIIWISENEIAFIQPGQTATATWQNQQIPGTITQVDMAMNLQTRAFRAYVEFDNKENLLKAGTTVDISIVTSKKTGAIVIERKNIINEKKGQFVFVANNQIAEKRPVTVGLQQGLDIEILNGLNPGDNLITEGQLLLDNGSKIKIME